MVVNGWPYIQIRQRCKWDNIIHTLCVIPRFLPRLCKPEALTAAAIVTKEHWKSFIPFDKTSCIHDGSPLGKEALLFLCDRPLTFLNSGGVEDFQQDYAFTAWASSVSRFKSS